jgi:membrane protein YdbS with pleckstrin-like domain
MATNDGDTRHTSAESQILAKALKARVALVLAVGLLALAVVVLAVLMAWPSLSALTTAWIIAAVAAVVVVLVALGIVGMVRRSVPLEHAATPGTSVPPGTTADDQQDENPHWSAVKALVTASIVSCLVLALIVGLLILLGNFASFGPEEALSLVFVAAAVVLILVVCTLTIVLKRLRLTNDGEAMGLPRGSIRAVIALMLILLFFIAAIFLFNSTHRVPPTADELRTLQGVDAARLATIPTDQIQKQVPSTSSKGVTTYTVTLLPSAVENQTSDDLAKQLITVLGTLVTAVAAFYFGANTVGTAAKDTADRVAAAAGVGVVTTAAARVAGRGTARRYRL